MKKCHPKGHQRPKAIRVGGSGPACRPWAGWRRGCGASGTQRQRGMRERTGVRLQVGGLPPAVIPVRMAVVGCPISSQRTTYYTTDQTQREPIIRFGTRVSGGDPVTRILRLNNSSPCGETLMREIGALATGCARWGPGWEGS